MMWKYDKVHAEFDKCKREHVNSDDVMMKLYKQGIKKEEFYPSLEGILLPVYESAKNMGFRDWEINSN